MRNAFGCRLSPWLSLIVVAARFPAKTKQAHAKVTTSQQNVPTLHIPWTASGGAWNYVTRRRPRASAHASNVLGWPPCVMRREFRSVAGVRNVVCHRQERGRRAKCWHFEYKCFPSFADAFTPYMRGAMILQLWCTLSTNTEPKTSINP